MNRIGLSIIALAMSASAAAQQLAFPDAYGWGRFATGGRNGSVYHVTNLNDSGSGSLRDAVSQPNRIVVFDVAGVIKINSRMVFAKNLYVAGQTAPGEGITVYGDGVSFSGSTNSIIRYMRFRMGKGGSSGKDCAGVANGTNMIFDHCSFAWGLDETFSINPDGKGDLHSITLQNCIVGQGLLTHSAGGLMQADKITLYRNFYCDNSTRNNKIKGVNQYVNCLVYNWSSGCYLMGGDSQGSSYVNTTNNLFINGPSGGGNACTGANADFHIYAADNWQDRNTDGMFNPYEIPHSEYSGGPTFMSTPYDYPELPVVPATQLMDELLPTVGASLPYRDYVDYYMVDECRSLGQKGALLSTEATLPYGVPTSWSVWSGEKRVDSDGDGMPDVWEESNGTDPKTNDAMVIAANGYANIENYINSLTTENRQFYLRVPMLLEATASTPSSITMSWADYTEGEEGFVIEIQRGGKWERLGTTTATTYTAAALEAPATAYIFRVAAYNGEQLSAYAMLTAKTQPEQVELVDVATFAGETSTLEDGKDVLIDTDDALEISESASPRTLVVRGSGDVQISGTISGTGSVNKGGSGTLTLGSAANDYTGVTALHGGTISFNKIANGGEACSLGAAQEFAQNWVWNGGTWLYTGATAITNRSANLLSNTQLCISSSATLTMSGKLQGNGGLTLGGKGTLKPTSAAFFSYDGVTRLEGSTLNLDGVSMMWSDKNVTLGSANKVIMAGGTLTTKDANDTYSSYLFDIETVEGTKSTVSFHRNCSIKSRVYGGGDLTMKVNYVREYINGNWDDFTGRLTAEGVGSGQQLMLNNANGIPNGVVVLKTDGTQIISWKANASYRLGGVSGAAGTYLSGFSKQTDKNTGTWIVGGAGTDETFNGVIDNRCSSGSHNCTVNIVKEGAGVWRLTGANVYSGTTVVNGGALVVNGSHTGTGAYTVNAEGTLAGRSGKVAAAVTVNKGGVLRAGDPLSTAAVGTFTISGKVTMNSGSTLYVPVTSAGRITSLSLTSMALKSGVTLHVDMDALSKPLAEGKELKVFTLSKTTAITGKFTEIYPSAPADGMEWDTSYLYTSGILRVKAVEDAVRGVQAAEDGGTLYNLSGQPVGNNAHGIIVSQGRKIVKK